MNKNLFGTKKKTAKYSTAVNLAGGIAYDTGAEHSLAQYACTGTFNGTFYASAKDEMTKVIELANQVSPTFLAKCAVYSRKYGHMKDMPAVLLAVLSSRDSELFKQTFPQVCTNGKMVKNFVQVMRSGVTGRSSLGSAPKKAISAWLSSSSNDYLMKQSVGNDPSLADVIKMVHPSPKDKETENFYGYLLGKGYDKRKKYPEIVTLYENFKNGTPDERFVPDLPFQMLSSQKLTSSEWTKIALNGAWQFTRMNLNNFNKYGVFQQPEMTALLAARLVDKKSIEQAKVFPYQLFQAYRNTADVPRAISNALQEAMDISVENIPEVNTTVHIGVDSSGSMRCAAVDSFSHKGQPVSCVEVAGIIASSLFRANDSAHVYTFDTSCVEVKLNPRDSIISNTRILAKNGGGTDCSSFLRKLNETQAKGDLVVMVSDNESWASFSGGMYRYYTGGSPTQFNDSWALYKKRNPKAVLVCIDLTPGTTAQAVGKDVLLVGGFSDNVFSVISKFLESGGDSSFWVNEINKAIEL